MDFEQFKFWTKFFWYGWKKHHFTSPDFCLRTNVFLKKTINLSFFCTLGKRLSHVGGKRSGSLLEFALYVTRKSFWKKIFLEKNCLQLFFRLWAKHFQTLGGFSRQALHKIHFSILEQMSESKIVWKTKSFVFFTVLWGRFSHFRQRCWVSFPTSALKPCRILFSLFSSFFCGFWTIQVLNEVLLVWMEKASFYQSRFLFEDKCFSEKNYKFVIFLHFGQKTFTRRRQTFRHPSPICVVRVQEIFLEKKTSWKKTAFNFCFDFRQNVSRLSAVFFGLAFHNFHFSFLEQNVGVTNCLKNQEVMIFPISERKDFALQTKLMIRLSQNCILRTRTETLEQFVWQKM